MSYHQLTENERYQIYALKKAGHSQKEIAMLLGRSCPTISRELNRNSGLRGYRPGQAHRLASIRRCESHKACKVTETVVADIETLIRQDLSPQQVVTYLKKHRGVSLHHETIYQLIYADKSFGGDLYTHLRIASKPYRKRYGSYDRRGKIKNRVSIDARPEVADRRNRIGDWEGDTVIAKGLDANIYFAHPYASRERGINDNTNGLIRQYFPKGKDFNTVSDEEVQFVMDQLNTRPRATRGNRSPMD